jgi:twinkle protein
MAFVKTHQPCLDPDCGGPASLSYNDNGTAKCFKCGNTFKATYQGSDPITQISISPKHDEPLEVDEIVEYYQAKGAVQAIPDRGLSTDTAKKYGIHTEANGTVAFTYCNDAGEPVSAKVRGKDKTFRIDGASAWKSTLLYGQHLFSKGGKYITICEGEFDAASAYQMMGSRYPVVSVKNGAGSALQDCTQQFEWLSSFDNVILCFDADEPGRKAADDVAKLFGAKAKIVKHANGYKDASDYLQNNDTKLFVDTWWKAEYKRQGQVVDIHDFIDKAMEKPQFGISFPWKTVTQACFGIRPHTIHVVGAAPKIGKTDHQHQLIHHLVYNEQVKVGVFDLENSPVRTAKKLASKEAKLDFTRPDVEYTDTLLRSTLESLEGKVRFYDRGGSRDWEDIRIAMTEMHLLDGINIFFIDPITALISRYSASEANDKLNEICTDAADFVNQYPVTLFFYSHVNPKPKTAKPHEAGGKVLSSEFTGSRAMEKWFHYGHGLSRDRTDDCPEEKRNISEVYMLFDREYGQHYKAQFKFEERTVTYRELEPYEMMEEL